MSGNGAFETIQGAIATVFGAGQLGLYYIISTALANMFPSWSLVIYGVAGLFGLEALLMLGFGIIMLYVGVKS